MKRTDRSADGRPAEWDADSGGIAESSEGDRPVTDGGRDRRDSNGDRDRRDPDGGRDRSGSGEGRRGSDDGRDREEARRRKRRAAVRPHESTTERGGEPGDARDEPGAGDRWSPPGVDPDDVPWYFSPISVDEPDPPPIVDRLGSIGIYLALAAFVLAVVGVGAAWAGIQPFGNAAIMLSLGLGLVAMLLGMVFQAVASNFRSGPE